MYSLIFRLLDEFFSDINNKQENLISVIYKHYVRFVTQIQTKGGAILRNS